MREVTYQLYQFNELAPDVQEKIIERSRDMNVDYDWWRPTIDMFVDDLRMLGVDTDKDKIFFRGFNSQGDGACFVGTYSYQADAVEKITSEFPNDSDMLEFASALDEIQKKHGNQVCANITHNTNHYSHERSVDIDVYLNDSEPEDNIEQEVARELRESVAHIMRQIMRHIYITVEKEYEYLQSDGCIRQSLENDDTEYLACGRHAP